MNFYLKICSEYIFLQGIFKMGTLRASWQHFYHGLLQDPYLRIFKSMCVCVCVIWFGLWSFLHFSLCETVILSPLLWSFLHSTSDLLPLFGQRMTLETPSSRFLMAWCPIYVERAAVLYTHNTVNIHTHWQTQTRSSKCLQTKESWRLKPGRQVKHYYHHSELTREYISESF